MMKNSFFGLLIVSCTSVYAQEAPQNEAYQTTRFANKTINSVEVKTSGGAIAVSGAPASEARVEVYVRQNGRSERLSKEMISKQLAENYTLTIALTDNKLVAMARPKERNMNWKKSLNISFKVFVPQRVSTQLATSGGSIHITNLVGTQNFSTSGGSLQINQVKGDITGKTSGGSIHAEGSSGDIDLATSGGSIALNDLTGTVKVRTSGGSIKGTGISGELVAHTSGGSIRMADLACSLETSTSGGQIDIAVTALGKYVKVSNSGGNINLQLPQNSGINLSFKGNKIVAPAMKNFTGKIDEDEIEGELNGGGVPVAVNGGGGRINFSLK